MSRRVWILALLVLIVGGWVAFRELPGLREEERRAAQELRLFGEVPAPVDTLRIRQAQREILVVRDGEQWWLRSPIEEEALRINVENLIVRLAEAERWRRVATAVADTAWVLYGLGEDSPARVRIELIGGGSRAAIDVGELTAGSRTAWVRRVGSDELWLALEELYDIANMSHHGLRNPRLYDVSHEDLDRIGFVLGDGGWTAARDSTGLWYLGSVDGERLRRWVVEDYAFAVANSRVDGYLRDGLDADDWAAYGLDRPWGGVEWETGDGRRGAVWYGNELGDGLVFGRRDGLDSVFRIAPETTPALEVDPRTLIDRNPVARNFLRALKIRVHLDEGWLDVIRDTPGVSLAADTGPLEPAEYPQVAGRNLQLGLEEMQPLAEMIVPAGQDPVQRLDAVEGRLTVVWPDEEIDLVLGRIGDDAWLAIDRRPTLWQVDRGLLLRLREVQELR